MKSNNLSLNFTLKEKQNYALNITLFDEKHLKKIYIYDTKCA